MYIFFNRNYASFKEGAVSFFNYVMDLCPPLFGFVGDLRKLHGLEMEQGPPRSGGDLEGA